MPMMEMGKIKPHPRNTYFFDDMTGDKWRDFKESVSHRLIHPIIVTQDLVIVSGHQRFRAYQELGKTEIEAEIKHYDSDDEVLLDLINSNLKERVVGNDNPLKLGRCFRELDRIAGVQGVGRPSKLLQNPTIKQSDIAEQTGISRDKWLRYESLTKLIPELAEALQTGRITATAAAAVARKLSPEEQKKFLQSFEGEQSISGADAQHEIERLQNQIQGMNTEITRLRNQPPKIVTKEVVPDDYHKAKRDAKAYKQDFENQRNETAKRQNRILELEDEIRKLKVQTAEEMSGRDLKTNAIWFCAECSNFIERNAGLIYIATRITELPEKERKNYLEVVKGMYAWSQNLMDQIERSLADERSISIKSGS